MIEARYQSQIFPTQSWRAVLIWLLVQIAACTVNSLWLEWNINKEGAIFLVFASSAVTILHVVTVAFIIRYIRSRNKTGCMALGTILGFVIPIALFLLIRLI